MNLHYIFLFYNNYIYLLTGKLPNLHILRHLPEIATNFGTLVNTSVSLKEAVHGLYKRVVLHTNKKNISKDLAKWDNTLQTSV